METNTTEGVQRLEKLQKGLIPDQVPQKSNGPASGGLDKPVQEIGPAIPDELAKQWMNRVEADPGRVLRRQFEVEERREWEHQAGSLIEIRPW